MMRTITLFLCFLLIASGSVLAASELQPMASGGSEYRIFMVNSYDAEFFWSAQQSQGIKDALSGLNVVSQEYFMDSKRHPDEEWLIQQKEICLAEIAKFKPDLILTGDDNATRTIATHFLGRSLPVVFYGVNAEPEIYGLVAEGCRQAPGGSVTGVLERHHFFQAVCKLKILCHVNSMPIKKIYLLTDDSYSSKKLLDLIREKAAEFQLEMIFLPLVSKFSVYQRQIDELNHPGNAVFIFCLETIRDSDGRKMDYREILVWTRDRLKIPSIANHREYVEEGLMYGQLLSGYNQAFHAGLKARKILLGTPPGKIPIEVPSQGVAALNKTTCRRLGFKVPLDLILGAEIFE